MAKTKAEQAQINKKKSASKSLSVKKTTSVEKSVGKSQEKSVEKLADKLDPFLLTAHPFPKEEKIKLKDYHAAVIDLTKFIESLGPIMNRGKEEMVRCANDMHDSFCKSQQFLQSPREVEIGGHLPKTSSFTIDKAKEEVCLADLVCKKTDKPLPPHVTELLILNRYLLLLAIVIGSIIEDLKKKKPITTTAPYFRDAYDKIMKAHASYFTSMTFSLAIIYAPDYSLVLEKLQQGTKLSEAEAMQKFEEYLEGMNATNRHVSELLTTAGYTI